MPLYPNNREFGFTLVELSIVLVIIGLIVGGVLVGQDLIKSAEFRKVINEKEKIITSVNAFKLKYNCLPGDCANATSFFGTDSQGCNTTTVNKTPKTQTCNGNGDKKIAQSTTFEQYIFWQHLSAAGLWGGIFRGTTNNSDASGRYYNTTVLPPMPKVSDSDNNGWLPEYTTSTYLLDRKYANQNALRSFPVDGIDSSHIFTPDEAFMFDSKFDDGNPASGSIQTHNGWVSESCTTPEWSVPAEYNKAPNFNSTYKLCTVLFLNTGF